MADGIISKIQLPDNTIYDVVDNTSGYMTGMTILSYGGSTWQNFIDAYSSNKVVYCRASSNSNPASGSQTRLAFMAYVNNATTPTEVEFQYYRSVSTHTASQQGDQVYVYKLNKTNGWSVTIREASVKVVAGTGLGGTYSNGTMTLTGPTKVSDLTNDSGFLTSSSTLDASKLSGAIPSAVTATTQSASDNSTKIATTAYVTTAIANLPEPMLFKGSVGTGGTITSLPAAATSNEGFTYKVITALSTPVVAKVGDTVISNGSTWVVIPSGDEPAGTVTSVGLSNTTDGGLTISGSPITSNGTISVGHSNVLTAAQTTQAVYPIKIDKNGHISEYGSAVSITDEKLRLVPVKSGTTYYPIVGKGPDAATRQYDDNGFQYTGTFKSSDYTNYQGYANITLGNSNVTGTAYNQKGVINLYSNTAYSAAIHSTDLTDDRSILLPDKSGTVALTSDIPSYTATSPIDITSGVISHKTSGVTAGTYAPTISTKSSVSLPSVTVDANGHITSASGVGATLYDICSYDSTSAKLGFVSDGNYARNLRSYESAPTSVLTAGNTSKTITISSDSVSSYSHKTSFTVVDCNFFDKTTNEPLIVDWSASALYSGGSSLTLTVTIAEAYSHDIAIYPILTYGYSGGM